MYIPESGWGWPSKLVLVQRRQHSCLVARDTSEISSMLGMAIGISLEVRTESQGSIPGATGILGFLSIFKRSQASCSFEARKSAFLSVCQGM